jgi:DHA2 family multidrug resistance protein
MELRSFASRRTIMSVSVVLATLLSTLDATVINVALPHMQGSLQANQDQIAWVLTTYIVATAITMPLTGWLGTRFGLRKVLAISVLGFTLGSVGCGLATSLDEMIFFRIAQGIFGAALVPLSQVALLQEYPPGQQARVMALWTMGVLVGPVLGPTLGGYLTDLLSWRWAFFINVPVGILAYFGILEGLEPGHQDYSRPFDWLGFILLSLGLGLLQMLLDRGHSLDWFTSGEVVAEAFFGALCLYMFVVHASTTAHPFVDRRLFRDRNFLVALALMFVMGMSMSTPSVLVPTFQQSLQGYTPLQAGTVQATRGLASIVAVFIAGRLVGRIESRLIMTAGLVATGVALLMFGHFSLDTPRHDVVFALVVAGFTSPVIFVPLSVAAYATLRPTQRAEAGVMMTLARNIGSSVGISAAVTTLSRSAQVNSSYLAEHFSAFDVERWRALGATAGANSTTAHLIAEIQRQAAAIAYSNVYYVLAIATVVVAPLIWLMRGSPRARPAAHELGDAAVG